MAPTWLFIQIKNMYQRAITQDVHGLPSSKLTIENYRYGMNMEHSENKSRNFPNFKPAWEFPYLPSLSPGISPEISGQVVRVLGDLGPVLESVAEIRGYGETLQDIVEKFKDAGISLSNPGDVTMIHRDLDGFSILTND